MTVVTQSDYPLCSWSFYEKWPSSGLQGVNQILSLTCSLYTPVPALAFPVLCSVLIRCLNNRLLLVHWSLWIRHTPSANLGPKGPTCLYYLAQPPSQGRGRLRKTSQKPREKKEWPINLAERPSRMKVQMGHWIFQLGCCGMESKLGRDLEVEVR